MPSRETTPQKTQAGGENSRERDSSLTPAQTQAPTDKTVSTPKTWLKKNLSKKTIFKLTVVGVVVLAAVIYLAWDIVTQGPLMQLLSNRDRLVQVMHNFGPWAPFFFVTMQILQVVVAPIPGQIVGGVGGFLFGHWGILWTAIGSFIGFWLVFCISRKFGRPLIEKIFKKSAVEKFDFIINAKAAPLIIFLIFLLPGFPDDLVCYIAGLTKISIKKLMLISVLGRFPVIVLTNYIGMGLSDNLGLVAGLSVVAVIIVGIVVRYRERILALMKHNN